MAPLDLDAFAYLTIVAFLDSLQGMQMQNIDHASFQRSLRQVNELYGQGPATAEPPEGAAPCADCMQMISTIGSSGALSSSGQHLAAGIFPEGAEDAPDALLHVVCDEAEGVDGVVNVLGGLEVAPKAHLPNHIKALPLQQATVLQPCWLLAGRLKPGTASALERWRSL